MSLAELFSLLDLVVLQEFVLLIENDNRSIPYHRYLCSDNADSSLGPNLFSRAGRIANSNR